MNNKSATWYKTVGTDNRGAVKLEGRWVGWNCLHCARNAYPEKFKGNRWQGPPSPVIITAMNNPKIKCGGKEVHQQIFAKRAKVEELLK